MYPALSVVIRHSRESGTRAPRAVAVALDPRFREGGGVDNFLFHHIQ